MPACKDLLGPQITSNKQFAAERRGEPAPPLRILSVGFGDPQPQVARALWMTSESYRGSTKLDHIEAMPEQLDGCPAPCEVPSNSPSKWPVRAQGRSRAERP